MIRDFILEVTWNDLLDLAATTTLIYSLLLIIRGTRAVQIIVGLLVIGALYLLSRDILHLTVVATLLQLLLVGTAVTLPVVFQPELRRGLESIGRGWMFRSPAVAANDGHSTAGHITGAALQLSRGRIGGLIALEVTSGLQDVVETGTRLDARVSQELLVTLFAPKSPLHDGAVVVKNDRIVAAGCVLPLSEGARAKDAAGRRLGTRHRAGIGLSEQTDAVLVIVSEETGNISIARNGKLSRVIDDEERLRKVLLACSRPPRVRAAATSFWTRLRGRVALGAKAGEHG